MNRITKLDVKVLRREMNEALATIASKHNVNLVTGNCRYNSKNATFKIELSLLDDDGEVEDKKLIALRQYYPNLVNKHIKLNDGTDTTVVGYNSRAKKYPFIVSTKSGQLFKITERTVKN